MSSARFLRASYRSDDLAYGNASERAIRSQQFVTAVHDSCGESYELLYGRSHNTCLTREESMLAAGNGSNSAAAREAVDMLNRRRTARPRPWRISRKGAYECAFLQNVHDELFPFDRAHSSGSKVFHEYAGGTGDGVSIMRRRI
jgi:hypothetical protein